MKRTIESIKEDIQGLLPYFSHLPKQKKPRNKKEWIEQHEFLASKLNANDKTKRVFSSPDILFTISEFLIPRKTSDFKEFLVTLREGTLVLKKVSKTFKVRVYALLRRSIQNFIPPLNIFPPQYNFLMTTDNKTDFLRSLDVLEAQFMYMDNKWPYSRVLRVKARRIWSLHENDFDWSGITFDMNDSCKTCLISWVAMTCHQLE